MSDNFETLRPGDNHYKAYVGPPKKYDLVGAMQFNLLTNFGLRDYHKLLDIGCGSLRSGKLMITYLRKDNYYGIEPNNWLIEEGIANEIGDDLISIKTPKFINSDTFELDKFNEEFDYLIAQSIFSHTSEKQIIACLKQVKKVMKPKGVFLATFVLGNTNYKGDEWVYPECVTFTKDFINTLVENEGLKTTKLNTLHPNSQTWYAIYHPNNHNDVMHKIQSMPSLPLPPLTLKDRLKNNKLFNNALTKKIYRFLK